MSRWFSIKCILMARKKKNRGFKVTRLFPLLVSFIPVPLEGDWISTSLPGEIESLKLSSHCLLTLRTLSPQLLKNKPSFASLYERILISVVITVGLYTQYQSCFFHTDPYTDHIPLASWKLSTFWARIPCYILWVNCSHILNNNYIFCLHFTTEHTQRLRHGRVGQPGPNMR